MKIESLSLNNFLSYAGENNIPLGEMTTCVIVGDNGVGKSSILEAVMYALFGQSRAGSDDELSHGYDSQEKKWAVPGFLVELGFRLNDVRYRISRKRTPRGGELRLWNADTGKEMTGNGIRETQAIIEDLIGMEYDSFVSSVMLRQNDYDEFMKMTPAEAKEVVLEILGLDSFEDKRELASEKSKTASVQSEQAEQEILRAETEMASLNDVPVQIQQAEAELAQTDADAKEVSEIIEASQKALGRMQAESKRVQEAHEKIESIGKERPTLYAQKKQAENEYDRALHSASITEAELSGVSALMKMEELKKLHEESDRLGKANVASAPVLRQLGEQLSVLRARASDLDTQKKNAGVKSLCLLGKEECHRELLARIDRELASVIEAGKKAREEYDSAEKETNQRASEAARLTVEERKCSGIIYCLDKKALMEAKRDALDKLERELLSLIEITKDSPVALDDIRAKELEIMGMNTRLKRYQAQMGDLRQRLGQLSEALERRKRLAMKAESMKREAEEKKEAAAVYSILAKAFSKEGIPALMIENLVPALEADANAMLERLSDGRIRLQFHLQRVLKGGGMAESFQIYVTDENGTRSIQMFSGGEKYRVIFAIHSAFSKYLAYRSGAPIGFLAIDEPAGLDEAGIQRLVETLSVLKEHYSQIFVITHLRELMEYFPQTIVVEKDTDGSKVTVRGGKEKVSDIL